MQSSSAPRPRGRPRSFDRDAAAAAALGVLWAKGYEATTVEDLVAATGLAPSSLYAAFGNKHGVLQAALARYDRDRDLTLMPLEAGSAGLDDLRQFLTGVRRAITAGEGPGCFMVNTATEVAPRDDVIAQCTNRYRERIRDGVAAALDRAAVRGEIERSVTLDRARLVQSCLYGALVAARGGAAGEAAAVIDALERQIDVWAVDEQLTGTAPGGAGSP